jgi:glycopeptide antibiotics resistance protein
MRGARWALWKWWVLIVLLISGPWFGFVPCPQWWDVNWLPFADPADKPKDLLQNVLLYVPFGWSYASGRPGRKALAGAIALAMIISIVAESTQLFSIDRYPSTTDVLMALLGTALGFSGAFAWRHRELP